MTSCQDSTVSIAHVIHLGCINTAEVQTCEAVKHNLCHPSVNLHLSVYSQIRMNVLHSRADQNDIFSWFSTFFVNFKNLV